MENTFKQITEAINKNQKILIISHNKPDGDTVGSNLALRIYIKSLGKEVTSACADPLGENLRFLPESDSFVQEFLLEDYDLIIIVDAGAKHLVRYFEKYPELNRTKKEIICIDHHFSNDKFGTINLIEPNETSTTTLLYRYFATENIQINKDMATCLLNGIYTDTGSFMHGNTKSYTLKIASYLMQLGADSVSIAKNNFKQTPTKKLKLMGEVLKDIQYDNEKIISGVSKATFQKFDATSEDLGGVVDFITSIPNAKYSVLYTEDDNGGVKASLRTRRDDINVAEIAQNYGGGGHSKAAGYKVKGRLEKQIKWEVKTA